MKLLSTLLLLLTLASCGSGGGGSKPVVAEPEPNPLFRIWNDENGSYDFSKLQLIDGEFQWKLGQGDECKMFVYLKPSENNPLEGEIETRPVSYNCHNQEAYTSVGTFELIEDANGTYNLIFTVIKVHNGSWANNVRPATEDLTLLTPSQVKTFKPGLL